MSKSNLYRPECLSLPLISVAVGGTTSNVDVSTATLPPGMWKMGLALSANVTGTTTDIELFQFLDASQSVVAPTALGLMEPDATEGLVLFPLVGGGSAEGQMFQVLGTIIITGTAMPAMIDIPVPYGLRLTVTNGTAVAGEKLEVTLIAQRA